MLKLKKIETGTLNPIHIQRGSEHRRSLAKLQCANTHTCSHARQDVPGHGSVNATALSRACLVT